MPTTYAPRYVRLAPAPNFALTERVLHINAEICRHGLIRQDQLRDRFFADQSPQQIDRTIKNLFHNGFIARPRQQQELHRSVPGSQPTYLAPDRLGVLLHRAYFRDPVASPKYTQENDHMTWGFMRHQHTTSSTMLNYRVGANTIAGASYSAEHELWLKHAPNDHLNQPLFTLAEAGTTMAHSFIANAPKLPRKSKIPLRLATKIDWDVLIPGSANPQTLTIPVATEPDGYFATHKAQDAFFFVESDEGTETILPGKHIQQSLQLFTATSLYAKYLIYSSAFRKRAHVKQFGIPSFRVITVTSTPRRVDQIIERLGERLTDGPLRIHRGFFLFTDRQTLADFDNNPFHPDHHHKDLAGDDVTLLA
jgi:Replication-relaxation